MATNQEELILEGGVYFKRLTEDILAAKSSVEIETYIFELDFVGRHLLRTLIRAAKNGVKVRIVVDGFGSAFFGGPLIRELEEHGVRVKVFRPAPWHFWQWAHSTFKSSLINKLFYWIVYANRRNHKKVCIIDHEIAWVGSFNVSRHYLPQELGGDSRKDAVVRVTGSPVKKLIEAFDIIWQHRWYKLKIKQPHFTDPKIRLNHTRHHRRLLYKGLLEKLDQSQGKIWITNAYFIPEMNLLRRLKTAARKGHDVRLLLPKNSDVFFMPWAISTFYEQLLQAGVRIYEYLPGFLHAKTILIDDWAIVGSTNLNHRSLFHDLEVDIRLDSPECIHKLETQFLLDLKDSKEVRLTDLRKLPWIYKIGGHCSLYLKNWI